MMNLRLLTIAHVAIAEHFSDVTNEVGVAWQLGMRVLAIVAGDRDELVNED